MPGGTYLLELMEGIHLVPGVPWSRVYLIEDADSLAVVDAGLPFSRRGLVKYIRAIGRDPAELAWILTTHSHPDHTSDALAMANLTGATIVAHRGDSRTHSNGEVSLSYMRVFNSTRLPVPFLRRTPVGRLVEDGDSLPILEGARVLHTPGHTPGSVCYLLENRGVLFAGDTLFSDGARVSRSVPFPGSARGDYRSSISRLASLEFDTLCGGHGAPLVGAHPGGCGSCSIGARSRRRGAASSEASPGVCWPAKA